MNKNSFTQSIAIDKQNEEKAWDNFVKTGRVMDYLTYYEYKEKATYSRQEALWNAHSHKRISNKGN